MIRIGIECEQLEGERFGVGHTLAQLLSAVTHVPDVEKKFQFVLYFKTSIPSDAFLNHPLFEKKILTGGVIPRSFNVFYHVCIPIAYWRDRLDGFFFPSYMLPAFFVGKAIVVLTNDVYWEAHHGTLPFRYRLSYRMFCWWAAKRARKIMTISQFSAKELRHFYNIPGDRIVVNPWGLEPIFKIRERTPEYSIKNDAIKKQLGIAKDFFLSVGQAFPRRHMKEAVEAFGNIAHAYPNIQYVVACIDKYQPPVLDALIKKINKREEREAIIYTRYISRHDLIVLMNEARALVYVSDKEALGLPPLEALACGRPSVVADTPLSREVLGNEGFFVENTADPLAIARQMSSVLDDEREATRIVHEQSKQLQKYQWDKHVQTLFSLCEDVAHS